MVDYEPIVPQRTYPQEQSPVLSKLSRILPGGLTS
jgi:hypothetical protein